jgi:hypothetical protein
MLIWIVSFYHLQPLFHCKKNRNKFISLVLMAILTVQVVVLFHTEFDVMEKVFDEIVEDECVEIIQQVINLE